MKPEDGRYKSAENLLESIDRKKTELDSRPPLTEGEVERLTEEFVVEYTYNSNAIEGNTLTLREIDMVLADKKDDRGVYRRVPVRIMGQSMSLYSRI